MNYNRIKETHHADLRNLPSGTVSHAAEGKAKDK
jgi:hypothetical protein